MTVSEFIAELQKMPQDSEAYIGIAKDMQSVPISCSQFEVYEAPHGLVAIAGLIDK